MPTTHPNPATRDVDGALEAARAARAEFALARDTVARSARNRATVFGLDAQAGFRDRATVRHLIERCCAGDPGRTLYTENKGILSSSFRVSSPEPG